MGVHRRFDVPPRKNEIINKKKGRAQMGERGESTQSFALAYNFDIIEYYNTSRGKQRTSLRKSNSRNIFDNA